MVVCVYKSYDFLIAPIHLFLFLLVRAFPGPLPHLHPEYQVVQVLRPKGCRHFRPVRVADLDFEGRVSNPC